MVLGTGGGGSTPLAHWRNVDGVGARIEEGVWAKADILDPEVDEQANPARSSTQAKT